jgi:hypothetical protein
VERVHGKKGLAIREAFRGRKEGRMRLESVKRNRVQRPYDIRE